MDISFLGSDKHMSDFKDSRAGACFVSQMDVEREARPGLALLEVAHPQKAFATVGRQALSAQI